MKQSDQLELDRGWATPRTVARRTASDIETVRRWCRLGRVKRKLLPGGEYRIKTDDDGYPVRVEEQCANKRGRRKGSPAPSSTRSSTSKRRRAS